MKRRKALSAMLMGIGGAIAGPSIFLSACNSEEEKKQSLTDEDIALLDEIGETIIPETTDSPGARAAKVGAFMKVYLNDCYPPDDQQAVFRGLPKINEHSRKKYHAVFAELSRQQRKDFLVELDKEAFEHEKSRKKDQSRHYFSIIKDLTILGYYTSEPGATKGLRYMQTPGYYDGSVPYKKGEKAWA